MSDDIKDLIRESLLEMLSEKRSDFSFRDLTKVLYINRSQKSNPGFENCLWYLWDHDKKCAIPIVEDTLVLKFESVVIDGSKTYEDDPVSKLHVYVSSVVSKQRYKIEVGADTVSAKCMLSGLLMLARKLKGGLLDREIGLQVSPADKKTTVVYVNLFNPKSGVGVKRDEGLYQSIVAASAIAEINSLIADHISKLIAEKV